MADVQVDPVFTLTPAEATAKLAELEAAHRGPAPSAEPKTPAEAAARLRAVTSDKKWGERFLNGSVTERREFQTLTELASGGDQAPDLGITTVNSVTDPHALPPVAYNSLIDGLREQGLPDTAETYMRALDAGVRTDRPAQGDGLACKQALDRLIKDAGFRQRVLDGDLQANGAKNTLDRIIAYAADDGQPATDYVRERLSALGLR